MKNSTFINNNNYMTIESEKHKQQFYLELAKETQENVWRNEMNLMKHGEELKLLEAELEKLNATLAEKGKPAANAESKQQFVLERNIEGKKKEMAVIEATKAYNLYYLTTIYPHYFKS